MPAFSPASRGCFRIPPVGMFQFAEKNSSLFFPCLTGKRRTHRQRVSRTRAANFSSSGAAFFFEQGWGYVSLLSLFRPCYRMRSRKTEGDAHACAPDLSGRGADGKGSRSRKLPRAGHHSDSLVKEHARTCLFVSTRGRRTIGLHAGYVHGIRIREIAQRVIRKAKDVLDFRQLHNFKQEEWPRGQIG